MCQGGDGVHTCSDDGCICSQCRGLLDTATRPLAPGTPAGPCAYARSDFATCQKCLVHHIKEIWTTCTGPFEDGDGTELTDSTFCHQNQMCGLHDITHFCLQPTTTPPPPPPPTAGACLPRIGQPAIYRETCEFARGSGDPGNPIDEPRGDETACASWQFAEACEWVDCSATPARCQGL